MLLIRTLHHRSDPHRVPMATARPILFLLRHFCVSKSPWLPLAASSILHSLVAPSVAATDITTYRDAECQISQDDIKGPNGYPDGACTLFSERTTSNFSSFQVVDLDPECGVTIYGPNSDSLSCSSTAKQIADIAHCYNTSWLYYSIDNCTPPDEIPSTTTTAATPNPTNQSSSASAIIGGSVGGAVALLASILGAIFFFRRRKRTRERERQSPPQQRHEEPPPQELPGEQRAELQAGGDEPKYELPSKSKPSELLDERSAPAEMEGDVRFLRGGS
ncbi:uncharacterized protein BKCO1_2500079 [Diplodia corticola]|uniref:Uncharacterized protein n=1 Tax=Diplodia corticola TaxID=236234 RepID=A0A1J9S1Z8_9PEZI|nr:uncharacterized protein BKCO1_2500079 [Diplodia corticola]OJD34044.1 hypothetical protein BKCO1_2500079 [Diplodia corticola]